MSWQKQFNEELSSWVKDQKKVTPCACLGDCHKCGWHLCKGCLCWLKDFIAKVEADAKMQAVLVTLNQAYEKAAKVADEMFDVETMQNIHEVDAGEAIAKAIRKLKTHEKK